MSGCGLAERGLAKRAGTLEKSKDELVSKIIDKKLKNSYNKSIIEMIKKHLGVIGMKEKDTQMLVEMSQQQNQETSKFQL